MVANVMKILHILFKIVCCVIESCVCKTLESILVLYES